MKMRVMVMAAVLLSLAVPAHAQSRLPRKSPAERQVEELNRSMLREGRQQRFEEQIQTDNNLLRQDLNRLRTMPAAPVIVPVPSRRGRF
jgi:hypothetical protein